MTPKDVIAMTKENDVKVVDIRYMDFIGTWQHFSVPVSEFSESAFEDGFGFDGSSMRAWQAINNSDMIVIPEPATARMDPFSKCPPWPSSATFMIPSPVNLTPEIPEHCQENRTILENHGVRRYHLRGA